MKLIKKKGRRFYQSSITKVNKGQERVEAPQIQARRCYIGDLGNGGELGNVVHGEMKEEKVKPVLTPVEASVGWCQEINPTASSPWMAFKGIACSVTKTYHCDANVAN